MPDHLHASHRITVDAPVDRCFMLFTPAGETLWVDGWSPAYVHPRDGRTAAGMVFTTGEADESTIWMLAEFDRDAHRARYVRCTPGSRTGWVDVRCRAMDAQRTEVEVAYTLTALAERGREALAAYEGERFRDMIDGWAQAIAARRADWIEASLR